MVPSTQPPVFIQLGRYGDIILLLPCFKAIHDRTGHKPIVITGLGDRGQRYGDVLDGVSYVKHVPTHWGWWEGMPQARKFAEDAYGGGIIPQWWKEKDRPEQIREMLAQHGLRGAMVLQCHGHSWGVDLAKWPNFMTSMWDRAGFSAEEMRALPVVFDLRDLGREKLLVRSVGVTANAKPVLLLNFNGHSSPFGAYPEVYRVVNRFAGRFQVVDLGKLRAHRIYDLLGLYDVAAGLITIDTATLHLAGAGNVEYVAFTVDGWTSSVPKGKCLLEIKYNGAERRVEELMPILERWAGAAQKTEVAQGVLGGGAVMSV